MSYQVCVRIPDDLYEKLKKQSDKEYRTVSNMVISILAEKYQQSREEEQ